MIISAGDSLPDVAVFVIGPKGPIAMTTRSLFVGKKVVLFTLPGAFTPTCSARHLPGFLDKADATKAKGIDLIACVSVNDIFVMSAWADQQDVRNRVLMVADGNAAFVTALGLDVDQSERGMGVRARRSAIIVENAVVQQLFLETPGGYGVSSAEHVLGQL
jgi:glutaredoxin/glutathione-dependent peroxiredoxin